MNDLPLMKVVIV